MEGVDVLGSVRLHRMSILLEIRNVQERGLPLPEAARTVNERWRRYKRARCTVESTSNSQFRLLTNSLCIYLKLLTD